MLLAFLSQVKGVPKDYSVTYLGIWMAIHLAKNVDYLWVKIFTYSIHLYTGISNLYIIKSGIDLEKSIIIIIMFIYIYIHESLYYVFTLIRLVTSYIYTRGTSKAEVAVTYVQG